MFSESLDADFTRLVRNALAHLYDYAFLQDHELARLVDAGGRLDRVARAQQVRRVLLRCLEALRSETPASGQMPADRAYDILNSRYVDGLSIQEIAVELALSPSQVYREHARGVEAVAAFVWDMIVQARREAEAASPDAAILQAMAAEAPEGDVTPIAMARSEADRLRGEVHVEPLQIGEVCQSLVVLLAPRCLEEGIRIVLSAPEMWPSVLADRVLLRQTLLNLFSYALEQLAPGELTLSCEAEAGGATLDAAGAVRPARDLPLAVEMDAGSGISLSVAQALLDALGGRLRVETQGEIWHARLWLPAREQTTLLVVDDNAGLVALFQRYLGGHDVRVVGLTDSQDAVRLAAELQPRAITLDVMMPHVDGWEILQRLKIDERTRSIPVIVCSVLKEAQLAVAMGASDYLTKPATQPALLQALERQLGPLRPAPPSPELPTPAQP